MNIEQLEQSGQLLYGDQWQSNLARELSIDSRRVRQWLSGTTPVSPWVGGEILQLLKNNQSQINQFIEKMESDMNTINKIKNAASVNELCELLNEYESNFDSERGKPEDFLDYSNLPTFGDAPDDTQEVFSWSGTHLLIKNNEWELVEREDGL
ncbi:MULTISPECIES: hypothetical protein [Psychrobacter]|uniref:hypothetical protein n=1 Tax=Psychrobacter TaxID=497 RepID=UPI001866855D|nr:MULTISPECIES: hypothetical protein [Psychrobacter]